jgi:hypothetical protein
MSDGMTIERRLRKTGDYEVVDEIQRLQALVAELKAEIANLKAIMRGDGGTDPIVLENNDE